MQLGRPKPKLEDIIKVDFKDEGYVDVGCKYLARDRPKGLKFPVP
jgi:hypothetical protein